MRDGANEDAVVDLSAVSQRDLLHLAPDPTVIVDEDGRIIFASARVLPVFGYESDELIGEPVEVLLPERFHDSHLTHRQSFVTEPRPRPMGSGLELFGRRKDGSEFPVEVSLSPVSTHQGRLVASTIRDITERKRTEALLARERAFLDSLIKTAPTMVLLLDPEGRIERVNPYLEQVSGYSAAELLGRDWFDTFIPENDRVALRDVFGQALDEGFNGHTNAIVLRDGSLRHVEWLSKTLLDDDGRLVGLLNIGHDVSETLAHEAALEQANAGKSRFLAAASHDLRQPLQSLGLYLSVLTRLLDGSKPLEVCAKMRSSLDTMEELLNALLDISRLDSGSVEPEIQEFSLDVLLDRIVTDNTQQAQEKGLVLLCTGSDCRVRSDPGLLERVLANLVGNAIRYTHEGRVSIECVRGERSVRIAVIDTGVGIPDEALERIFDEYCQLNNPARDRGKGLGLGLSIVRHIVRLLDLDLQVSSVVEQGSTFAIEVPLCTDDATRPTGQVA